MSETVSGKKVIARKPLEFDIRNAIPAFLDEGTYKDVQGVSGPSLDSLDDSEDSTEDTGPATNISVPTPSISSIASQTVRISEGGQTVVDVVINASDLKGIEYYEVRLSKI